MSYNNNRSGGSGIATFVVIILVVVGLFGGNLTQKSSNNSEYIDSSIENVDTSSSNIDSEIVIDSSEDIDSEEGFIKVEPDFDEDFIEEEDSSGQVVESIPAYSGAKTILLNNNDPHFTSDEIANIRESVRDKGYIFSDLDELNRPSTATAILTPALYNTEKRDSITVNPTAWKNKKLKDGSWLFNRSHLIGYAFINDDVDIIPNLITGTRDFNADRDWGMLHYEDIVREYLAKKGKHYDPDNEIIYQITPFFTGDNLLADGVQMRVQSLHNDDLSFNVFVYNVQDDVELNYSDGTSLDHTTKK